MNEQVLIQSESVTSYCNQPVVKSAQQYRTMMLSIARTFNGAYWAALMFLYAHGSLALAAENCGTDIKPCEQARPKTAIRNIHSTGVGQLAPGFKRAEHSCSQFRLAKREIRSYLASAGRITQNDVQYVVDESACVVTGAADLTNGKSMKFSIGELRDGMLVDEDGAIEHLYCSRCSSPPFLSTM